MYFSISHIEKFDATSKSSTPRRKVRCHVEKFDATSNSSTPRRKLRCGKSKSLTSRDTGWRFGSRAPSHPQHSKCHRLGSKVASAAHGGTSNLNHHRIRVATESLSSASLLRGQSSRGHHGSTPRPAQDSGPPSSREWRPSPSPCTFINPIIVAS